MLGTTKHRLVRLAIISMLCIPLALALSSCDPKKATDVAASSTPATTVTTPRSGGRCYDDDR